MRRWAFIIAIVGLFVLLLMLNQKPVEADSLEGLEVNSKVMVWGEVIEEKNVFGKKILVLENGVELVCECAGSFEGKEVSVVGLVEEYENKKQVEVLEMNVI